MLAQAEWAAKAQIASVGNRAEYRASRIARELVIRDAISQSCMEWIDTGSLPLMDRETALFVYERFSYGHLLGEMMLNTGIESTSNERYTLAWLLLDSWLFVSFALWQYDLS